MSNVQKENGYTPIANEILEQLVRLPLNGTQWRIIAVVWRYTYGFSRKAHELSEGFISKACGIHKKQIQRELSALISMGIISTISEATFSSSRIIGFNKKFDSWEVAKKLPVSEKDTHTGSGLAPSTGSGLAAQDKQVLKQILKQESTPRFKPPSLEDVTAYCKQRGNDVSPQKFFDYFNEGGWKDARGQAVKNWKQKVITWEGRSGKASQRQDTPTTPCRPFVSLSELVEYPAGSGNYIPKSEAQL